MTKYVVLVQGNIATIALAGYEPHGAGEEMGSFELNIDPLNNQTVGSEIVGQGGDHNFVVEAKRALRDNDDYVGNVDNLTFLDKASNAPVHPTDGAESLEIDGVDPESQTEEKSAQAGGLGTVDADEKDPNGVTKSEERKDNDADETKKTAADVKADEKAAADAKKAAEKNDGDNKADANQDEGETVTALKERLATVTDKSALEADYKAEQAGKNRAGAIAAYEARAKELEAPAE